MLLAGEIVMIRAVRGLLVVALALALCVCAENSESSANPGGVGGSMDGASGSGGSVDGSAGAIDASSGGTAGVDATSSDVTGGDCPSEPSKLSQPVPCSVEGAECTYTSCCPETITCTQGQWKSLPANWPEHGEKCECAGECQYLYSNGSTGEGAHASCDGTTWTVYRTSFSENPYGCIFQPSSQGCEEIVPGECNSSHQWYCPVSVVTCGCSYLSSDATGHNWCCNT